MAFATEYNWLIAALVFLMGVTIRHYFNTYYAQKGVLAWTWVVTVLLFGLIAWISTRASTGKSAGIARGQGWPSRSASPLPRRLS